MSNQHTTDEIQPINITIPPPNLETPDIRFMDIHIYDQEPEPEPEDTQQEPEPEPEPEATDDATAEDAIDPGRPDHTRRNIILACSTVLCLAAVSALIVVYVLPLLTPDAVITIVPNTQQVRTTATLTVTTGTATGTQLPGRALPAVTMNQARTVPTTGKGHQDAQAAQGEITFYNAAPYAQTITAGTLLTGADGRQVMTEQDAIIRAVSYPTLGQATVPAQSIIAGPVGNIQAGDIYGPCCRLNVSAVSSAFTGGVQARNYQTVTMQDITTVAASMKTSLNQSMQAALQTQVHPDETLMTPFPCQQHVKPDHQPGEEAVQVTILVSETCTGMTYQTQAFHTLVTQMITQQAHIQLGEGYTMQGVVQASINKVSQQGVAATLQTTIAATWGYQFTQAQQAQIKAQIAGKSRSQALHILLHIPGVQTVSIERASLPTDERHLHLVFLIMSS